nr:hypothetical protein CPBEC2_00040 [Clostridium perfringens]
MAGMVFIGEKRVDKAGEKVPVSSNIIFRGENYLLLVEVDLNLIRQLILWNRP